jgi:hypothetical protein
MALNIKMSEGAYGFQQKNKKGMEGLNFLLKISSSVPLFIQERNKAFRIRIDALMFIKLLPLPRGRRGRPARAGVNLHFNILRPP